MSLRLMSTIVSTSLPSETKFDCADKLLKQLLECVQECQKRYGGKTELATEFDSCVVALCFTLEAVLLHGVRPKPQENIQISTLKQVSDIVANSFQIGNEILSFWSFIKKHLTKHEQERYAVLKHIWTDTGRGRSWIRSSLNERSLERYFHLILSNSEILKCYYEEYAILRDQEKSSMLPDMAAGVGSILFAINIDKPELNSGIVPRIENLKSKAEPVVEAPILEKERHKCNKKKKKVSRQFISFDEDDNSILSTSVPSTSSSISSGSNSPNDSHSSKGNSGYHLKEIGEENKAISRSEKILNTVEKKSSGKRKLLSMETSGSREKFNSNVPETLTPVTHTEIGELTPISIEFNKNFESPDTSDDILEVPSDISEVLSAVETRNNEELKKKQEKIDSLTKENGILKQQIKKYVSAIQMLKEDDVDLEKALEDLEIKEQPDYKGEAKLFEKKLVQVAEMHAELMDFNVALQKSLCQKDFLLESLKTELEELRGPLPTEMVMENRGNVNIWIPSAFLTGSGSSAHHVYQIFLRAGHDEWNIYRRYAQFYALHSDLKKLDPTVGAFDFPPKKSLGKKDSALVEDRRKRLQTYLRRVLTHWPELAHCNSRFLLEQHLAFFKNQKDIYQKNKSLFSPQKNRNTDDNHYTGL